MPLYRWLFCSGSCWPFWHQDMQTNGFLTDCPQCERATSTVTQRPFRSGAGWFKPDGISWPAGSLQWFCFGCKFLGGGNSHIFYFHPDPWGNDPIWPKFFEWVGSTTNQKWMDGCSEDFGWESLDNKTHDGWPWDPGFMVRRWCGSRLSQLKGPLGNVSVM